MGTKVSAVQIAFPFREDVRSVVAKLKGNSKMFIRERNRGKLASNDDGSLVGANWMEKPSL